MTAQGIEFDSAHGPVEGLIEGPPDGSSLVVLAPGAGAPMTHEFMEVVAAGLAARGSRVCRFDFLYTKAGRRSPDRQPVLEATYRAVLDGLTDERRGKVLIAGGKSMGGRIASHVAAAGAEVDGLLFLGYPLHPPGRPERLRDQHLYDVTVPMLFVEGDRDPFCPLATLEKVRRQLPVPAEVAVIADGDHSFRVRKSSGRSTAEAWEEVVDRSAAWMGGLGGSRRGLS